LIGIGSVIAKPISDLDSSVDDRDDSSRKQVFKGIKGRVSNDGTPLVGALISVKSLDMPSNMIPEIAIISDYSGNYQWPLSPGRYKITAQLDYYRPQSKSVVVETENVTTVNFIMMPVRRMK
jgi:hypothetical protein